MSAPVLAVVAGFACLAWGADRFVLGAAATARGYGVSSMLIGLTVVALGTAAPEILVSLLAALDGRPGLAVGNALGSNVTNMALVLGAAAVIAPLTVRGHTLTREWPLVAVVVGAAWLALADGTLSRVEGGALVAGVAPVMWWLARIGRPADDALAELASVSRRRAWLLTAAGLAALLAGSRGVVWGATRVAEAWGVGDTVIGLSVVAVGTSLPELAASVAAALKREHDIAVGNVLGANLFNLLVVLGVPGLVAPVAVEPQVLTRDLPVVAGLTAGAGLLAWARGGRLGRTTGAALLAAFVAYLWLLYD